MPKKAEPAPRAVLYARFSPRPRAKECESNERQLATCRAWAESNALEVVGAFSDSAISGGLLSRPGFDQAVDLAASERAALVAVNLARIYRGTVGFAELLERLRKRRARLVLIEDGINTGTPIGEAQAELMAIVGKLDRQAKAAATSSAMLHHQAGGRVMTRPDRIPLGYKIDPHGKINPRSFVPAAIIPDPEERAELERLAQIREAGESWTRMPAALEAAGVNVRGSTWTVSRVRHAYERAVALRSDPEG